MNDDDDDDDDESGGDEGGGDEGVMRAVANDSLLSMSFNLFNLRMFI